MDKIKYRIILDAHKGGVQKVIRGFFAGDVASRTIAVNINASGLPCNLGEGTAAVMYVTKSNGVTNYGACEVIDNTVYYDVNQSDIDSPGIVEMQLKILNGESVLYAPLFALDVQESKVSDTEAEATPTFSALEAALAKAQFVYDTRVVSIEITPEYVFVVKYADDSEYTNDCLSDVFARADEAIQGVNDALSDFEESRTELQGYVDVAFESMNVAESMAQSASGSADASQSFAEDASEFATRAETAAERAETVADLTIDTELSTSSTNPIANKAVAEEFGKYIPRSGGTINGTIVQNVSGDLYNVLKNQSRSISNMISANGVYEVYDSTNQKSVIRSTLEGTNTFNGTASGNLPLDGGGEVTREDTLPIRVKNTASNTAYIRYSGKDGILGYLGMGGENQPVYLDKDAVAKYILHTGNMADHVIVRSASGIQTIAAPSSYPLVLNNTHASSNTTALAYYLRGTMIGRIGVENSNKPVFITTDNVTTEMLHTGNSAKVVIDTTAPNDTTGNVLFINTSA